MPDVMESIGQEEGRLAVSFGLANARERREAPRLRWAMALFGSRRMSTRSQAAQAEMLLHREEVAPVMVQERGAVMDAERAN